MLARISPTATITQDRSTSAVRECSGGCGDGHRCSPQSDISKDELRKLNDYLDQGGNVCFWMSPNDAEIQYTNIESILESFSLRMDYDIVAETDSSLHISGDPYTFRCSVVVQTTRTSSI